MTNYEKYKNKLIENLIVDSPISVIKADGKPADCMTTACSKCLFNDKMGSCDRIRRRWLNEETKLDILDDVGKEYLGNLIKPFKVNYISKKQSSYANDSYFLVISISGINGGENIYLPYFNKTSNMYEGMKLNKRYTLEELGLD